MSQPLYRYQICDLRTDEHITWLPLTGVSFDRRIVEAGSFSASMPLTDPDMIERIRLILPPAPPDGTFSSPAPGRMVCHVWRAEQLWGTYIIWRGSVSRDARGRLTASLSGASLESWLHKMHIWWDLSYEDVDQLDIARDLVDTAQTISAYSGNPQDFLDVRVQLGGPESSGVSRDRHYYGVDGASYGQRLEELAGVEDGPEWMIRTYVDADGHRKREFVVDDQIGDPDADHVWTTPGDIIEWDLEIDGAEAKMTFRAVGDEGPDGEPVISIPFEAVGYRTNGWVPFELSEDYSSVSIRATLNQHAGWLRDNRAGPDRNFSVTVRVPPEPTFTPEQIGDYGRFILVDAWHLLDDQGAPMWDTRFRIIGVEVTPADRGQLETMTLILEQ